MASSKRDTLAPVPLRMELSGDAAYIHFTDETVIEPGPGKSFRYDPPHFPGVLYFEFDSHWRLVGMEVMGAKRVLPLDLVEKMRRANGRRQQRGE
jgi:hypothetical protein